MESRCVPVDKAETFLAHIEIHRVALVVLDIWMAGMTGLEVQARLCSMCCQTRIIMITGSEGPDDERTAMQAGAMAFFKKPFDDNQFLAAVHDALAQAKAAWGLFPEAIVGRPKVP